MGKKVTIVDIAKEAGVSQGTVGRVLNKTKGSKISEHTAIKIRKIAKKLSYKPSIIAQQLAGVSSKTIGVLLDPALVEYNYLRLREIENKAHTLGYRLIIGFERLDPELVRKHIDDFLGRQVNGVICIQHDYPSQPDLVPNVLVSNVKHVIFIDKPAIDNTSYIGIDIVDGSRQLVEYLLGRGRRRIGLTLADLAWNEPIRQKQGYVEGLRSQGISVDEQLIWVGGQLVRPNTKHISIEIADQIINTLVVDNKADAIMANTDNWAAQLVNRLLYKGYRVPQDVAIVGYGNFSVANYTRPRLTTLDLPIQRVAHTAVNTLVNMIEDDKKFDVCTSSVFKANLVIGESA